MKIYQERSEKNGHHDITTDMRVTQNVKSKGKIMKQQQKKRKLLRRTKPLTKRTAPTPCQHTEGYISTGGLRHSTTL